MASGAILKITNIAKHYGDFKAIDALSFSVEPGLIYGLLGPNGAGKTTTIRMIMKIMYPDQGTIQINGREHQAQRLNNVGYLPEERGLYMKMKLGELLQFHGELNNARDLKTGIETWLKRFDLMEYKDKKAESLSKGMKQKLQFIATILHKPEIVILDEPFSGLDPVNAELMKDVILELQKEGTTIIFSTHDMSMAEKMCDYIFMIYQGKKVLDGTLSHIQDQYGNDTIRIRTDHGAAALENMDGVEKVNNFGKLQEVRVASGVDPQSILANLLNKTRITHFEIAKPSLNDIFIRIASPERKEVHHG